MAVLTLQCELIERWFNNKEMEENLFYDLSEGEMLALWKRVHRLEDLRRECVIERVDGINLDAYLTERMRQWYSQLLLTAPVEWLPVEDLREEVTLSVESAGGYVVAKLPSRCVRVLEVRLSGWRTGVCRMSPPESEAALRQRTPWLRAGVADPVVVDHGDHLLLYGIGEGEPSLASARCVAVPAGGRYRFAAAALSGNS